MAVSLKLDFKQTQKLVMTQTLRQSIEMLQLSTVEIAERIAQELLENPAIEEMDTVSDDAGEPESRLHASVSRSLSGDESFADRHDDLMKLYGDASESGYESSGSDFDRKRQYIENAVSQKESLTDHLLWQARMWALSENDYMLLQGVIPSLDSDGFLPVDAGVIAGDYGVPDERVMEIISVIQNFDPVGCAVSGMRESLLVQCRHFYPGDDLLHQMLSDKFTELEKYDYQAIASALKVKLEDVVEKGRLLHNLNPFPGRGYSRSETTYIVPDVEVKIVDGELIVTLNDDWVPRIGVNAYYSRLLRDGNIDGKQKEYIQEKLQSARYFLRNISSRRNTI
jgi:RNA polymerase sigma-54 factor